MYVPEHVLMSEIEIITDVGRRRWTGAEKLRIVKVETDRDPPWGRTSILSEDLDRSQSKRPTLLTGSLL
jgi:hypothetical protein